MEAVRPKKKRSELELLLGNGDAGGLAAFSPRLPALSISSPSLPEATAESDEQLARRLHEELNGMRMTRRGSKAVTEDNTPLSPGARSTASPHPRAKADTSSGAKSHHASATTPRASASAALPSIAETEAPPAASEAGAAAREAAGPAGGSATGPSGEAASGGGEMVKRKRNSVPARELHLLLQQAASTSGRGDTALSPTRSGRGGMAASRSEPVSTQQASNSTAGMDAQLPRRDSDRDQPQQQEGAGSGPAPVASTVAKRPPPMLPPDLASLPPKLKQRYLAGLCPPPAPPPVPSAGAAATNSDAAAAVATTTTVAAGPTSFFTATAAAITAVTPDSLLGAAGQHCSLLSGQSAAAPDSSQVSHSHSRPSRISEASASATATAVGRAAAAPQAAGSRVGAGTGASIGGCSSTDETEHDNDQGCAAAVAGSGPGGGGPSATSPKALAPVAGAASSQPDANHEACPAGPRREDTGPSARLQAQTSFQDGEHLVKQQHQQPQQQQSSKGVQGPLKVPKLPMIRAGRGWYRGRLLQESQDGGRVLVDVPGAPNPGGQPGPHVWLATNSDRIWRGSYKGKDWKYLGDGAWDPKPAAFKRGKQGSSSNGLPLPLPRWAVVEGAPPQPANLPPPRSRRDRGSAGVDEMSENADAQEEEDDEEQPLQQAAAVARDVPSSRPQRGQRRGGSPAAAPTSMELFRGSSSIVVVAGGGKGATGGTAAAAVSSDDAAAQAEAMTVGTATGCSRGGSGADVGLHGTSANLAAAIEATCGMAMKAATAEAVAVAGGIAKAPGPLCGATGISEVEPTAATAAVAGASGGMDVDVAPRREGDAEGTASAGQDVGASSRSGAVKVEGSQGCGRAGDGDGDEGSCWVPGLPYPRSRAPRRARQRQVQLRTPLVCLQLPLQSHQHQHNPYNPYALFSGDESAGEGDAAAAAAAGASDAEHGGRRGSDGAGGPHGGGRRRAAARAAVVAAAAARAEAEAEEEEQEEILLGRRPPRRDRDRDRDHHGLHGSKRHGNHHHHHHHHSNHQSRPRSAWRPDCYLYGDSSGALDDSFMAAADAAMHLSVRQRGSRAVSQPAAEQQQGSGGSMGWESGQWLQAMGVPGEAPGCAAGDVGAAAVPMRSRRKGKPCRSRMDGEGELCCYWDNEWELQAAGSVWARMPQAVRQLYYISAAADGPATGTGGQQQPQGGSKQHRHGGGSCYHGAQPEPNKRQRVYDEDPAMSPDDDLEIIDDPDQDEDYLPYSGSANGRRSSGYGGGRRCSANGGGWAGAATKRQRSGGEAALLYGDLGSGYGTAAAPVGLPLRRRILISYGPVVGSATDTTYGWLGPGGGGRGIPASLAGLIEAALGHTSPDDDGHAADCTATLEQHPVTATNANDADEQLGLQPGVQVVGCALALGPGGTAAGAAASLSSGCRECGEHDAGCDGGTSGAGLGPLGIAEMQVAQRAAQVALSDSSANHSSAGEDAGKGPGSVGHVAAPASDAAVVMMDAAMEGSTPPPLPPLPGLQLTSSQQLLQQQASGMSGLAAGGSPPPPSVQLQPGTPTRARRTGRPPSAALGTGAPLPKLPALSPGASLRLQAGASTGGATAAATAADGVTGPAGGQQAPGAATEGAGAVHLLYRAAVPMNEEGPRDPRVEISSALGDGHGGSTRGGGGGSSTVASFGDRKPDVASGCCLWQVAGSHSSPAIRTAAALHPSAAGLQRDSSDADVAIGQNMASQSAAGLWVSGPGVQRSSQGEEAPAVSPAGGGDCRVLDAIGALMHDSSQPAMRQLAMRAQRELDSLGLAVAGQQHHHHQLTAAAAGHPVHDEQYHLQLLHQQQQSAGRGRGAAPASMQRAGSMPCSISDGVLYGFATAPAMPSVPDAVVAALPSVDVVVNLFSARAPFGGGQQALADFVGGAAALPLFL